MNIKDKTPMIIKKKKRKIKSNVIMLLKEIKNKYFSAVFCAYFSAVYISFTYN